MNNQSGKFVYLKDIIILDTGSTIPATFINPNLVNNIKVRKNPITVQLKGQVGDQINARFDPSHIANIFVFAHMTDKYQITYDSDK